MLQVPFRRHALRFVHPPVRRPSTNPPARRCSRDAARSVLRHAAAFNTPRLSLRYSSKSKS